MSQDKYRRVKELFERLADLSPEQIEVELAKLRDEDDEILAEVRSLLALDAIDGDAITPAAPFPTEDVDRSGEQIGSYRLIERIGQGGMGEVYRAEQLAPVKRSVALKVIRRGLGGREILARFDVERQALAVMNHPNIARVLDAGTDETGRPYFVMEFIEGVPITSYCDRERLGVRERLELFSEVCRGVQHAHQKGVIHRDLKPGNILVEIQDGKPVARIIDFGVAKAVDREVVEHSIFTQVGQLVGTPEYMSPEQANLEVVDIDTRTDVYSLGVVLYELLVGRASLRTPEQLLAAGFEEMRRFIREEEPARPSTRLSTMGEASGSRGRVAPHRSWNPGPHVSRGDLDWVALRALEKDRERRYASAGRAG